MATALTQTTTTAAVSASTNVIPLTSVTGIAAGVVTSGTVGTQLYVVDKGQKIGETMNVLSVSGLNVTVSRIPGAEVSHASGAMVLAGQPNQFYGYDPTGATDAANTPWVNIYTGNQWLYSSVTGTWVPGFGNTTTAPQVTLLVASTAGLILPTGPLFHVNGTAAITGITVPVGAANGASFSIIPDAIFTWTAANNLALAGTAVVNKLLTFTYDATNSKWVPSYIA